MEAVDTSVWWRAMAVAGPVLAAAGSAVVGWATVELGRVDLENIGGTREVREIMGTAWNDALGALKWAVAGLVVLGLGMVLSALEAAFTDPLSASVLWPATVLVLAVGLIAVGAAALFKKKVGGAKEPVVDAPEL